MPEGSNKIEVLAAAGKRAAEMQPDTIRLIEAPGYSWKDAGEVSSFAKSFASLGFTDVGIYTVDVLPVAIRFLINESERQYAAIYEHPQAGVWINLVILYDDGTSLTFTNSQDRGLEQRPGHPIVYAHRASAEALHAATLQQARGEVSRKRITPASIVRDFEKAWADGIHWRKNRGISEMEVASVFFSQKGQPTRVLRPERIHFIAESKADAMLKGELSKVFDEFKSVQKAYLAEVRYDEVPNAAVTLCLFAAQPVTLPLVEAIRKTSSHLNLLLVREARLPQLEAVCPPFYINARW
jgi:hypothetical protein